MKNTNKVFGIIALVAVIGFSFAACSDSGGDDNDNGGNNNGGNTGAPYIITGSGTEFTAKKNGAIVAGFPGSGDKKTFDYTIYKIQNDANGADCTIQFGNGTDVLDIGTSTGDFRFVSGISNWGNITLTGKLTSDTLGVSSSTIIIDKDISINSTADISSKDYNHVIYNYGSLTINGGTVSGNNYATIYNVGGTVIINNGTVSSNSGSAIANNGTLTINGGTISSNGGVVIDNGTGTVIINDGTVSCTTSNDGITTTAIQNNGGTLTINGGIVSSNGVNLTVTIMNYDKGTITIYGGTVSATANTQALAIWMGNGALTINGGTVSATGSTNYSYAVTGYRNNFIYVPEAIIIGILNLY